MAQEIIQYHPSKSMGFGHSAKIRNPKMSWRLFYDFLNKYTIYQDPSNIKIHYNLSAVLIDENIAQSCLDELHQLFGEGDEGFRHCWSLNLNQLNSALELIFDINKWKKQIQPPVTLYFHYSFRWKDQSTGKLITGQNHGHNTRDGKLYSYCSFYIDYKVFVQPSLLFPYAYGEKKGMKHLELIKRDIPFRFSEKHIRRMIPTKAGRYRYLKLQKK